jgi:eukaryotic-like serine/threonine-protein kinase
MIYEHLGKIATGGMSEVHLGRTVCCSSSHTVAVKTIRHDRKAARIDGFLHECRLSLSIDHPNVVAAYEAGHDTRGYFLTMEAIAGVDLSALQRWAGERDGQDVLVSRRTGCPRATGSRMDPLMAAYIVSRVAAGLHAVHELRDRESQESFEAVHGDVSPQNIMIAWNGVVKLCDFGVARSRFVELAPSVVSGKPRYLSPEQVSRMKIDRRSDVFSLGLVMFELLSGAPLEKRFEFPNLRQLAPQVDAELEAIVMTAVDRDRTHRYQSARALQLALEAWMHRTYPVSDARHEARRWLELHLKRMHDASAEPQLTFTDVTEINVLDQETLPPPRSPSLESRVLP